MLLRETMLLAQFWVKWQRRMFELTRKKARRPLCWGLSVWPGDQSFCTTTSLEVASKAPMNRVNGVQSRGMWCIFCLRRTCDGVHGDACWFYVSMNYTYNYNCPEPKWNWSSKSHWAVINHHESPLDCHKSHSIPNIFPMNIALKCQANPPIKGWNPPFSHLFGASEANAASRSTGTTVTWRPCCQRRCEPTEAAKMPGICGNLRWFYGGSSWNLMLKMLTFRKLLVIYDSYGDLIWSNDI